MLNVCLTGSLKRRILNKFPLLVPTRLLYQRFYKTSNIIVREVLLGFFPVVSFGEMDLHVFMNLFIFYQVSTLPKDLSEILLLLPLNNHTYKYCIIHLFFCSKFFRVTLS